MNDPMPPESSFTPESSPPAAVTAYGDGRDDDRAAVGRAGDRKYDELIAVVLAFLGIGTILFWVLGKNPLQFAKGLSGGNLPGTGLSGANGNADGAAGPVGVGGANVPSAQIATPAVTPANMSNVDSGDRNNRVNTVKPNLAATAAAGAAATAAAGAAATIQSPVATTPAATDGATTGSEVKPPAAVASPSPEIVEPDVLPSATKARRFDDVPSNANIAPYVDALSSRKVLDDIKGNLLNPDQPITRAEFANLVSRAFGKPRIKPAIAFKDVPADYAGKAAIEEATRTGFMVGFSPDTFKPDLKIPRYQLQSAIVTGMQLNDAAPEVLSKFADSKEIPQWAQSKVAAAVGAGIVPAKGLTALTPNQSATRGEAIIMLHEALVKEGKLPAVQ
jgi:hypothetical protein